MDVPEAAEKPVEELFAERIKFEHELIGQRMTWLMTLNGFLFAGVAILIANVDKFEASTVLGGASLITALVGVTSNASCYFSNEWGVRAIRGAGKVVDEHWHKEYAHDAEERERRRLRMRLYGRDPRSFGMPYKPPPSRVLHPWLLLPLTFTLLFALLPVLTPYASGEDIDLAPGFRFLQLSPIGLFAALIFADKRHHLRRDSLRQRLLARGEPPEQGQADPTIAKKPHPEGR